VVDPKSKKKTEQQRCRLILDPSNAEGQWHSAMKGKVLGGCTLLTVAVTQAIASASDPSDLAGTCATALEAMRAVELAGYFRGDTGKGDPATFYPMKKACPDVAGHVRHVYRDGRAGTLGR